MWEALQVEETKAPPPPVVLRPPPAHRLLASPQPHTAHAVQCLSSHLSAWREATTAARIPPHLLARATQHRLRSVWRRWLAAWTEKQVEAMLQRRKRTQVVAALQLWRQWAGRRKEGKGRAASARRLSELHLALHWLQRWVTALHEHVHARRVHDRALLHHRRTVLPTALHAWIDHVITRRRHRNDRYQVDVRRRNRLLSDALHLWVRRLRQCREQQAAAVGRLLPLRLRGDVRRWVTWTRLRRAVNVVPPVALHVLFTWLSVSFHQPLPYFSTLPLPAAPSHTLPTLLTSHLIPTRLPAFTAQQQRWRLWLLTRLWSGWTRRVHQWRAERLATAHLSHLTSRHLLYRSLQHWHSTHLTRTLTTRRHALSTLHRWRRLSRQRRQRREAAATADLIRRFHAQRRCFALWKVRHAECRRAEAVATEEERMVRGMEEVGVAFFARRSAARAVLRWRGWVVHHLLTRCTSQLVQSRWSEHAKAAALTHWRTHTVQCRQAKALQRQREEMADVMYVGRLMSVLFVCWRLQLQRRLTLHRLLARRACRVQRERMREWKAFVIRRREERRVEREEAERRRKADDHRKAAMLARAPLLAAWGHWRGLMRVVGVGYTLAAQRRQRLLQRVVQGWAGAVESRQRRQGEVGEALRGMVVRWVKRKSEEEAARAVHSIAAEKEVRRRRLRQLFAGWARAGLEDYQQRQRALVLHQHRLLQEVWAVWCHAALPTAGLLQVEGEVKRAADSALRRRAMGGWRRVLHVRRVWKRWGGEDAEGFEGFVWWRAEVLRKTWQGWRGLLVEDEHERRAVDWHRTTAALAALQVWKVEVGLLHRGHVCEEKRRRGQQQRALQAWLRVVREEREEKERVQEMVAALAVRPRPSAVELPALLLSTLRPSLPSLPLSHYFRLLHSHSQQQRSRTQWAAHICHTLDSLLLRTAWARWSAAWEARTRRRGRFLMSRGFWTWKLQARRVREKRQLLAQAEASEGGLREEDVGGGEAARATVVSV